MAIYKRGREFKLGTTEHKSSKWPERDSNPGPPDCESDALTTRPRCLPQVEGPLSERSRPKVHIPWALGEEAARGFAEPNSEPEEVQIETLAASPPRRRRKRFHSLNDDSETD